MSAAWIWNRCRLDDELNKLRKYDMSDSDKFLCNDAKSVINATNCFNNDVYSLPTSVDSKVRELYPLLQQIKHESGRLTDYELERMAEKINFSDATHYDEVNTKCLDSCDEPFNHTYFPDYILPSNQSDPFGKSYEKPSDLEYKTPASIYRSNLSGMTGYDTGYGLSFDRRTSYGNSLPSNNLFNKSTCRSQFNTPGYCDSTYNFEKNKFLSTPINMNYKNVHDTTYDHKSSYNNDSVNSKRGFDYKNEFLTAFQPGNEYKNDYTTVETPVMDLTRNNSNEEFVSSFPWERYLNDQFITNTNSNSNFYNFGSPNDDFQSRDGVGAKVNDLLRYAKPSVNFSPNSPLRSFMNEDVNYNYKMEATPRRPYY